MLTPHASFSAFALAKHVRSDVSLFWITTMNSRSRGYMPRNLPWPTMNSHHMPPSAPGAGFGFGFGPGGVGPGGVVGVGGGVGEVPLLFPPCAVFAPVAVGVVAVVGAMV